MKSASVYTVLVLALFWPLACGQSSLILPDMAEWGGDVCGEWYPGGGQAARDAATPYGMDPGDTFPCIVFETARLNGEDTYINFGDLYLQTKHGEVDLSAVVIVIGADNCPGCAVLTEELAASADALDAAGALMIGAVWCNNIDTEDCDFDMDRAELVLKSEGWPTERWPITNDQEGHLRPAFGSVFPSVIVVEARSMGVIAVERAPVADDVLALVATLPRGRN